MTIYGDKMVDILTFSFKNSHFAKKGHISLNISESLRPVPDAASLICQTLFFNLSPWFFMTTSNNLASFCVKTAEKGNLCQNNFL